MRRRLDVELVRRGITSSRTDAVSLIERGVVLVRGSVADKASRLVSPEEPIEVVAGKSRFVSRGGDKLAKALVDFEISVKDRSVLDAGASTGGFSDCVLQAGARRVIALDVGKNQLHERVSGDVRVTRMDGVNARSLTPDRLPYPCSLVVADLSFISLTKVVDALVGCVAPEPGHETAELVLLVKPQFEVGRKEASRGRGVISDPDLHQSAVESVCSSLVAAGCSVEGVVESPIRGSQGNTEFLVHACKIARSL